MVNNKEWEAFIIILKLFVIYYKSARHSNFVIKQSIQTILKLLLPGLFFLWDLRTSALVLRSDFVHL